jgi:hypothetical protein
VAFRRVLKNYVFLLWAEVGQPCSRISLYRYGINQIDSKDYALTGLQGGSFQVFLTNSLYTYHTFSILATSPVHPIAGNTYCYNFCVQNPNVSCRSNTSFDHITIFISGILNLKIHHSASQQITTLHHDTRQDVTASTYGRWL